MVRRRRDAAAGLSSALMGQWLVLLHAGSGNGFTSQQGLMTALAGVAAALEQELGTEPCAGSSSSSVSAPDAPSHTCPPAPASIQAPSAPRGASARAAQAKRHGPAGGFSGTHLPARASQLLQGAGGEGSGGDAMTEYGPSAGGAAAALWQALCACQDLGLAPNVSLSLGVAMLHCKVQEAAGGSGTPMLQGGSIGRVAVQSSCPLPKC